MLATQVVVCSLVSHFPFLIMGGIVRSVKKRVGAIGSSSANPSVSHPTKRAVYGVKKLAKRPFLKKVVPAAVTLPVALAVGTHQRYQIAGRAARGGGVIYPGSNYIGPGNSLDAGRPTSQADAVAREHDYQYDYLQKQGVDPYFTWNEADRKAVRKVKTTSPSGAAVWAGLNQKRIFRRDDTPVPEVRKYGEKGPVYYWKK